MEDWTVLISVNVVAKIPADEVKKMPEQVHFPADTIMRHVHEGTLELGGIYEDDPDFAWLLPIRYNSLQWPTQVAVRILDE